MFSPQKGRCTEGLRFQVGLLKTAPESPYCRPCRAPPSPQQPDVAEHHFGLCQKVTVQEASTGHWKGQYPWPFGRDPNSSSSDVTSRVTDCNSYVCNPGSLKEGTETSRPVTTTAVPLSDRILARLLRENLNMRCTCCLLIPTL